MSWPVLRVKVTVLVSVLVLRPDVLVLVSVLRVSVSVLVLVLKVNVLVSVLVLPKLSWSHHWIKPSCARVKDNKEEDVKLEVSKTTDSS